MASPSAPDPPPARARAGAEVLHWPEDAERREALREEGRPRLLLLAPGAVPPPAEPHEDWAWTPTDERELASRLRRLAAAGAAPGAAVDVDPHGVLHTAAGVLPLSPTQAALLRCLAEQPIRVRERDELRRAAWGDEQRARRSLDSRILSLRRRIAPLGLAVVAVRGRGFVLAAPEGATAP